MEKNKKTNSNILSPSISSSAKKIETAENSAMLLSSRSEREANELMEKILKDTWFNNSQDDFKEQSAILNLLCREGASEDFLRVLFCKVAEINPVKVDLVHCAAILIDEEFALDLKNNNYPMKELCDAIANQCAIRLFNGLSIATNTANDMSQLQKIYDLHIEYLRKAQVRIEENYNKRLADNDKYHSNGIRRIEETYGVQLRTKDAEIKRLQDSVNKANKDLADLRSQLEKQKDITNSVIRDRDRAKNDLELYKISNMSTNTVSTSYVKSSAVPATDSNLKDKKKGLFTSLHDHRHRNKKERNVEEVSDKDIILSLISNPKFTVDQLEMIKRAIDMNLPLDSLKILCDPKIPVNNMDMMITYMAQKNGIQLSNVIKEDNTHE